MDSTEIYSRQTIAHLLRTRPHEVWTVDALANRYGIARSLTVMVLAELVTSGAVERLDGPDEEYVSAGKAWA